MTRSLAALAFLLAVVAIGVIAYSYWFHETTFDVYAHSSDGVVQALHDDADVSVEIYDTPTGGRKLASLRVDPSAIEIGDDHVRLSVAARSRLLPSNGYLQICVDGESDGHRVCGDASADATLAGETALSETGLDNTGLDNTDHGDTVSCSRTVFNAQRFWFSSAHASFTDVSCAQTSAPLRLAYVEDTRASVDGVALALEGVGVADLSELINQTLDARTLDAEVAIEGGTILVEGPQHEDDQQLLLVADTLFISNGNSVDLSSFLDNSDSQTIDAQLTGSTLSISLENGGSVNVELSSLVSDTDDQFLSLVGDELTLSNGDDADSLVDLTPYLDNTDLLASIACAPNSYLVWNGASWVCTDITANETLTTVGYDVENQTIEYTDEAGQTTSIPITALETTTQVSDTLATGHIIGTYTNEDGDTVNLLETVTSLVDNGDQTFTYTAEDGSQTTLDVATLETLTTLTNTIAGNRIGTYVDEDGTSFDIDETVTSLVDNGDGTLSFGHEDGSVTTLDAASLETLTTVNNVLANGNRIATYVDEDGATFDIFETVTSLVDNGDGTFSFVHEDGSTSTLDTADLETLTTVTNTVLGNRIGTYTDEDGATTDIHETITSLVDNGDGTFSFVHEDGSTSTLDVADLETLTTITNVVAGNRIGTYVDEDGNATDLNETITSLVDNGDGTFSFVHEDGSTSTLDAADLETLTSITNVVAGNRIATYIDEDGVSFDVNETITELADNGDGTFSFVHEDGTTTTLDVSDLETLTSVTNVVAGNRIATYIDEDGVSFDVNETITELADNGDGTFSFVHEDGTTTTLDVRDLETLTTVTNTVGGNRIATYIDEDGVSFDVNETITELADNGDGTFSFVHEDGTATTLDVSDLETLTSVTNVVVGNRIATYVDEDGVSFDVNETITELADNGDGTFSFVHEDGTTTTLDAGDLETLTTVTNVVVGNRIATYVDEDGVSFDVNETITELADNGDGTFSFVHEDGTTTTLDARDLETLTSVTNTVVGNRIATYVDEDGNVTDINETVTTTTNLIGGSRIGTYTDENGVSFDVNESITELVDNGDGTFSFTHEDGTVSIIDAAALETLTLVINTVDGNRIATYVDEDGTTTDLNETITELVDNGDGTFTFTHEDGSASTLDAASLETLTLITGTVDGNRIATYVDEDGTTTDLNETITELVDNGDGTFTFTHEDGSTSTLDAASLETLTLVTNTLVGNRIATYVDEDGTTTDLNETITTLVDNGDQTFTFTHEDGSISTLDATNLETLTSIQNTIVGNRIATYIDENGMSADVFETVTALTNTTAGFRIATYTDETGTSFDVNETITQIVDNTDGTFTYTQEDGTQTTISGASLETLTFVSNTIAGNRIGTYTDEAGNVFDIDETITSLVDNTDGTFSFTHEDGTISTLSAKSLETLTTVTNLVAGNRIGTYTDEDGVSFDIDETITSLVDNGDGTFTFTHEDGSESTLNTKDLETLTLVTNTIAGNRIATYTDEDGVTFDVDETITSLADNGDGTFTFVHEDGSQSTIDAASLETLTTLTNTVAGNRIGTYTDEDGVSFEINETVTTLVDNGNQTLTFTHEDGTTTVIDATALETLTLITNTVTGNRIATYTDEDGATFDVNETITSLVNNGDRTFTYTDERGFPTTISGASLETLTFLANTVDGNRIGTYFNEQGGSFDVDETITELVDNGDGTFTFTHEGGGETTISAASLETLTQVVNTVAGHRIATYIDEDGVSFDIDETITALADNGDGTFTFTHEDGTESTLDAANLETLTVLNNTIAGNRIGTYTDEDGASFDIDETITALVDNGNGTFTFTHEGGTQTTISAASLETLTTLTNTIAGNRIGTYTDEDGNTFDIDETITALVDNGNGTFTFTHEDGSLSTLDASSLETLTLLNNTIAGNRIGTYTDEDGATFDIDETITALVDNGDQTMTFTHEDGSTSTIDVDALETITLLNNTIAGNRIATYTDEDGVTFDIDETITELTDNGDGTFTFTHEDGSESTLDAANLETLTLLTNTIAGNRIATYTDEDGVSFDVDETITALVDNGNGTFTFTHEGGGQTTLSAASLETLTLVTNTIAGHRIATYVDEDGIPFDVDETITALVDNGNGTFTFTHEDGSESTLDAASLETLTLLTNTIAGNRIGTYTDEDGVSFDVDETITALVDNGNGTFTFTHEGGTQTTISAASLETLTTVTNTIAGNRIATYTDEDGVSFDVDETITALVDNGDGTFTFTHEDGSETEISAASLETLTTVTNLLDGNRIATYTDEDGNLFDVDETITELVDNGDGTFTFTHEDGSESTLDTKDLETLTLVTNTIAGNRIGTYTDEDGATFDIDESITALADNGDGTFTFTHEDGSQSTLNAASLETLTFITDTVVGNQIATYIDEDGVSFDINETITTLVDNGDQTFTFTHEDGSRTTLDATALETLTLVTNTVAGNKIATYTDEDGFTFDINETITSVVDNGDGTFTFVHEDGSESTIDAASLETLTTVTDLVAGNLIATYTDEDGIDFEIDETITSVVDNGDQTVTFTNEAGTVTTLDVTDLETLTTVTDLVDGNRIATYTDEDGFTFDIDETVTTVVINDDQTVTFTNEAGAVTTLDVAALETLTTVTDLVDGNKIATYTDEDGVAFDIDETITVLNNTIAGNRIGTYTDEAGVSFDLDETITALVDNGDGTFTFTHEGGSKTTISAASLETLTLVTNTIDGNRIATYTDEDGFTFDVDETITALKDNGDQTVTFTNEAGVVTTLDVTDLETLTTVTDLIAGNQIATYTNEDGVDFEIDETVTALKDNGDGTFTFTHEDGLTTTISAASLETLTTVTDLVDGNKIATYTDEDGFTFDIDETVTTVVINDDQTVTFTNEAGAVTTLDVAALETLTTVTDLVDGNKIATYTDEDGVAFDIDETITVLNNTIAGNRIGTYTDEAGVSFDLDETITALVDNGDGTFTFTHEGGSKTTISAASLETLTLVTNTIDGNRIATYTDEDGFTFDVDETITALKDNGDQTVTFTNEAGVVTTLDVTDLETLTTVTDLIAGNQIATYTNEDGVDFEIDETVTALKDNGDGTFTFTHEDGLTTTISAASLETLTTVTDLVDGNKIATYTDEDGFTFDIDETVTTVVINDDQTVTFTNEAGAVTTLDVAALETLTTVTDLVDGNKIATYTDEDGVAFDIDETITVLNNTIAGNRIGTYTDEAGVSFDLDETITALVDNGDGTFTFTHEGGSKTTISAASLETLTLVTNTIDGNRIATYTDEDGFTFDVDETITALKDNGDQTVTFTNEAGVVTTLDVTDLETLTTVTDLIAGNQIATYTNEDGVDFEIDETVTALKDNGDGTFTFTHEDGLTTTISAASLETLTTVTDLVDGNKIATYTDEDGFTFDIDETVTTVVINDDQTVTFTNEAGAVTTLDVAALETLTTVTDLVDGNKIATYTDEDGVAFDIDETITVLNNTIAGNRIGTYTDEAGVSFDLDETITALVDNGDGTFTFTHEGGSKTTISAASLETLTLVTNTIDGNRIATYTDEDGFTFDVDETITALKDNGDGTFTFTHEDGLKSTISAASLETLTLITDTVAGNKIATYTDEDGMTFAINETVTKLVDNGDQTFTFTHEDGSTTKLDATALETLTLLTNTVAGNRIATYTDEDGMAFDINETITSVTDNGDGTFTFIHEDGSKSTIDAASLETLTTVTNTIAGNRIATYTDEDGDPFDIDETITELVDNGDGTFTFVHEDGSKSTIDAASIETLTTVTNTVPGNLIATYTDEDGVATNVNETITTLTNAVPGNRIGTYFNEEVDGFDVNETITTLKDNGDGTFTFTHEGGTKTTISAASLETLTTVTNVVAGNRIATYTDEDGLTTDVNETITVLVDNGDGTFTFRHEDGSKTTIKGSSIETLTTVTNVIDGNRIATYTDEDGITFDINETITKMSDNGDGTFTFIHEDGSKSTIDAASLETLTKLTNTISGNRIGTYTDEDGIAFDIDETITELADNGDGTFTFVHEDGSKSTLDVAAMETLTSVTNTIVGNRIGTYTDELGVTIDLNETITSLVDNGNGTLTFTDEAGVAKVIDASDLETLTNMTNVLTAGNQIGTYTNEDGVAINLFETVTSLVNNGDQTFTFTNEAGTATTLDIDALETLTTVTNTIVGNRIGTYTDEDGLTTDLNETITALVDNGDGTFTFTHEDGSKSTINAASLETLTSVTNVIAGNRIGTYTDEDGIKIDFNETITTLVDNGNQTFTFTHEGGSKSTISVADLETLTTVTNVLATGNLIATYTDEDGGTFDVLETVTALVDNGDGTFTFTHEDGSQSKLDVGDLETLTTVTNVLAAGNRIGTYTDEDGGTFDLNETVTNLVDNGNGTFTFTHEGGTKSTLDVGDLETLTSITNVLASGNRIATYTAEDGGTIDVRESITNLVDNGNQTFTFTAEDGSQSTISASSLETLTSVSNVLVLGHLIGTYTDENGATVNLNETITNLADNGDRTITFTHEDGSKSTIDIGAMEVLTNVTNVLAAGNRIGTYTNEDNVSIDINETVTSLVDNGNGTFTFTHEDGMSTTLSVANLETLTTITNTIIGNRVATYTDEDGIPHDVFETVTSIVDNGNSSFSFTSEGGTVTTIDYSDTLGNLACLPNDMLVYNGANWVCTPPTTGADDQQLKLSGSTIFIEDGNSVTFPTQIIYEETFAAGSDNGTTMAWGRNMRIVRTGVGQWQAFFDFAHADATRYAVSIVVEESAALRDSPLPWVVEGTKGNGGFNFAIVTGDNGLTADPFVNAPFTVSVDSPIEVLVPAP